MSTFQPEYSSAPIRRVREVQFGIMSPEEIKSISVVNVIHPEVMEEATGEFKTNGLMDPRMGTVDRNDKCGTCSEGMQVCPGHFGHIELARPVYHMGFMVRVKKILESICIHCGKLKVDINSSQEIKHIRQIYRNNPKRRFDAIWKIAKTRTYCEPTADPDENHVPGEEIIGHGGCGHTQPLIRYDSLKIYIVNKISKDMDDETSGQQSERRILTASDVFKLFKKMEEQDLELLGLSSEFARPEWMILTVLPVPPPPVRPSVAIDGGTSRSEDDLTYKLADIIKASQSLKKHEQEGAPAHILTDFENMLQWHVSTYMNNDIAGIPQAMQKSGRAIKSIRARLKGKEGRLRGNLMGKRVDFSARTVITGDPNLALDEVGVPRSIAKTLTYPERVTPYNITRLQQLVSNGAEELEGANYVIRDTGERYDLRMNNPKDRHVQYGWIVERHLQDGDIVLFNRQPSLHKMSMMAHRVRVMDWSTFRLNLSVTPPYNADFDGDEMNLHVPQGEETRAELSQIAAVPRQIISPQANRPVMGIVQDTLCGIRKFTMRDSFLDWRMVQNILMWVPEWDGVVPIPAICKPKPLWSGKQICSMCIPKGINIPCPAPEKESFALSNDDLVFIEDGEIIHGEIRKLTVGATNGGLVHVIFREKGNIACRDFFSGLQMVVNYWLLHNGFSIGIGDTILDASSMADITALNIDARTKIKQIIHRAETGDTDDGPFQKTLQLAGMTLRESIESHITGVLNQARDNAGKNVQLSLKPDNNVVQMVNAGSKGSFINIAQMTSIVGQQSVEGKRIPFGFKHRTLPHFTKDDFTPEARGYVENSYLRGLTPQEFFFHAMAGREGLIDTAVKTAETGYIQRRLVKAMEDVMVHYDGTVRNSLGDVLEFVYGEDGMDGAFMESQVIDLIRLSDQQFDKNYRVDVTTGSGFVSGSLQIGLDDNSTGNLQRGLDAEYKQLCRDRTFLRRVFTEARIFLPVNIQRLITNARQIFHIDNRKPSNLNPLYIIDSVTKLSQSCEVIRGVDVLSRESQANATHLFRCLLRSVLATRNVIEKHRLSQEALDWIIGEIETKFNQAVVQPGEMCGTLAAQSIGEPATQMTLNTFHYAGVGSKSVTVGVPRLKEIINVAENIKTPSHTIYLEREYSMTQEASRSVQTALAHTTLRTVTAASAIIYDPDPRDTIIEEDKVFVDNYFAIPDEAVEMSLHRQSPWLLRLELDRAVMLDKKLEIAVVNSIIAETFENDLFVICSDDNAEKLVIRCRSILNKGEDEEDDDGEKEDVFLRQIESNMLDSISLQGVSGIHRVYINNTTPRTVLNSAGEFTKQAEYYLETDGTNLRRILTMPGVDPMRTSSNNSVEVLQVLGIEAARASLLRELRHVIVEGGSYVNNRHMYLLCDLMTHRGRLMAITRHGINRADTGALMRCSFEETVEILMDAAAAGEKDDCSGVAENILLGQVAPMGTGAFQVSLDLDMLKDAIVDHRLPIQNAMAARALGSMTPGAALLGGMTPYDSDTLDPMSGVIDGYGDFAGFSPIAQSDTFASDPGYLGFGVSPMGALSPGDAYIPASPAYAPTSPMMGATSPWGATSPMLSRHGMSATSPAYGGVTSYSPTSPVYSPASPNAKFSPASPSYSPASPSYSPTSPNGLSPASPRFSPASPSYSPASPAYSPTSPTGMSPASPRFSPASPSFSPASPSFSPASPRFSPASPRFSPASPRFSPASPSFSPASPRYSPTSPKYSPTSPRYSPTSPAYSPTSPQASYSPQSPAFSPASPQFDSTSPKAAPTFSAQESNAKPSWQR